MNKKQFCKANLIFSILIIAFTISAYAVPMNISYQGFLLDNNGSPINGDVTITFNLYATDIDNQSLWSEIHSDVKVTDGIFNVILGTERSFNNDLFDSDLYLGISINGSTEMSPRRQLTSTAFSMRAREADFVKGSNISDHSIDITKLAFADQDGNIEISGNISANCFIGDGSQLTGIVKEDELKRNNSREYSGAFNIGVFDSLLNSNSSNLQDVLDDLDEAISNQTGKIDSFKNETEQQLIGFQKNMVSIESGSVDKWTTSLMSGSGERSVTFDVRFEEPFIEPPKVLASITRAHVVGDYDYRLFVSISNISKDGFQLSIGTWQSTRVEEVAANWIAYGYK
jgi:hypothetical protein